MKYCPYLVLFICFLSCKSQKEIIAPTTKLSINLLDTNSNLIALPINVYLFTDSGNYKKSSLYYTGINAFKSDTAKTGTCLFDSLNPSNHYYIYAHYRNYSGHTAGYYIDYDNRDSYIVKQLSSLANGASNTTTNIIMKPANGLVSFWVPSVNSSSLPLKVYLDNNLLGTVTEASATIPTYYSNSVLTTLAAKGAHTYYAESAEGCIWQGEVIVKGGADYSIELYGCGASSSGNSGNGNVVFWADTSALNTLPITIYINGDSVGAVTEVFSNKPTCYAAGAVTMPLPASGYQYNYLAKSQNGDCILGENSFTVVSGECSIIHLNSCTK